MGTLKAKVRPTKGFAHIFHVFFSAFVPILLFILVRIDFVLLAVLALVLSKWRMFSVKPRFWPAVLRANAVDLFVGFGTLIFMSHSDAMSTQVVWTILFIVWQLFIKPGRSLLSISSQSFIGQTYGLMALFVAWPEWPAVSLMISGWVICYMSARHFMTAFEEPHGSLYAHAWGYFAAALMWLSSHWLIFYGVIAQPTLLLSVLGFGLAALYYLRETDRLSQIYRREIVFIMCVVVIVVLAFSDWGDKAL